MKRDERKTTLRCAIYTRVSTDSGLEQDFNSLDNQREASEAYVRSQAHEGWKLVRDRYDDGGYSGGSMERPALQKLLAEVRARKIDVIVVYKVDRLTRSLADFAKLVELFDAHGVSFISVTQAFNTTTSMGRLTLNMLLSFAQFEREITGERIRDKVAASKRKGIWMGGAVPLGYRVEKRALHIVEDEAEFVRSLFRRYLETGSVVRLKTILDIENVRAPISDERLRPDDRRQALFARPPLLDALEPDLHRAVASQGTDSRWPSRGDCRPGHVGSGPEKACFPNPDQSERLSRTTDRSSPASSMTIAATAWGPHYAAKGGRRWRYYASRAALTGRKQDAGSIARIPAGEIEKQVADALRVHLAIARFQLRPERDIPAFMRASDRAGQEELPALRSS